jgi:hypothetical protein
VLKGFILQSKDKEILSALLSRSIDIAAHTANKGENKNGKQKTVDRSAGIRDKFDIVKLFNVNYYI